MTQQPKGRRKEAAAVNEHTLYYARQQEQMRDKIMNERKEEQILLENDYTFVEVKDRLFTIYKKENPTDKQIKEGKEYRVNFLLCGIQCFFDTNEQQLYEKIEKLSGFYKSLMGVKK